MVTPETVNEISFETHAPVSGNKRSVTVINHRQIPVHHGISAITREAPTPAVHYEGKRLFPANVSPVTGQLAIELRQRMMV